MTKLCSGSMKTKKKNPHRWKRSIWKEKIEREIEHMGGELSILTELQKGINVKGEACRTLQRKYKINKDNVIIKNTVKQKLQLKAQRLRRYEKRNNFYRQNMIFKRDGKKFYQEIGKETITSWYPLNWRGRGFLEGYMEWRKRIKQTGCMVETQRK